MTQKTDGVYDRKPWDEDQNTGLPRFTYTGPFASNEERLTQQALMVGQMTADQIRANVKVPLPQIRAFPDRYGYDRTALGIQDILSLDRRYVEPRVAWFSGSPAGYSATSRNALG